MPIPHALPGSESRINNPLGILAIFDLLSQESVMNVFWVLGHSSARRFADVLQRSQGLSSSELTLRLKDLFEAKLLTENRGDYSLSEIGRNLFDIIQPVDAWSKKWASAMLSDATDQHCPMD